MTIEPVKSPILVSKTTLHRVKIAAAIEGVTLHQLVEKLLNTHIASDEYQGKCSEFNARSWGA